jgi:hypothetical protein
MAADPTSAAESPAPASEHVHLPGPSLLPVMVAAGITAALVGLILNPVICALGVIVTVGAIIKWISDTRTEIAELPLEHE